MLKPPRWLVVCVGAVALGACGRDSHTVVVRAPSAVTAASNLPSLGPYPGAWEAAHDDAVRQVGADVGDVCTDIAAKGWVADPSLAPALYPVGITISGTCIIAGWVETDLGVRWTPSKPGEPRPGPIMLYDRHGVAYTTLPLPSDITGFPFPEDVLRGVDTARAGVAG